MSAELRNLPAVVETATPVKRSMAHSAIDFFAPQIRNKNTRMAYYRAVCHFCA